LKVTAARKAALDIMRAMRSGELADRAFVRLADTVPPRDRAWLQELVYGTLRLRGRLDYILTPFVKRGLSKLDADVMDILRLGAYQLLEMDSVPAYAAVSQAVELTKTSKARSASGLVNGVLQSLRRQQNQIEPEPRAWSSHPDWLLDRWIDRYGFDEAIALASSNNARPDLFIRPVRIGLSEAVAQLQTHGINAEEVGPDALRIDSDASVLDVLKAVPAIVQDPAAGLVARYAALDGVIADLCAAPGGKAIALADRLTNGLVMAGDVSETRMRRLTENLQRIGNLPVQVVVADARAPVVASCDGVLLDAPCTGTGTFKRHPDGKWRIQPSDLHALVKLQSEMLDAAAQIVKPGGTLVYSTCSLEPEENERQVLNFLERHPDYRLESPTVWHDPSQLNDRGMLTLLPHRHGFDGAFAARMERIA
jgi:16S rRNA (cytosine967-C5)-methyltransferase